MSSYRLMGKPDPGEDYEREAYLKRQHEVLDIMRKKRVASERARKLLYKKHDEEISMVAHYLYYLVEVNNEY